VAWQVTRYASHIATSFFNKKNEHRKDVRSFDVLGNSLEDMLFQMEYADLWAKQDTFVRKFEIFSNERMVIITAQTGEGLIVDPERIFKLSQSVTIGDCLQKEGKKEKKYKKFKKISFQLSSF